MPINFKLPFRVALEGFSAFERAAMASFFRLADQRLTTYVQAQGLAQSDLVVADTDQPSALKAVLAAGRAGDAVFVGSNPPAGTLVCLPRPIDPVQIVRELDAMVEQRRAALPDSGPAPLLPEEDIVPDDFDLPPARRRETAAWHGRSRGTTPPQFSGGGRSVLVVDDSAIARTFLKLRLEQQGYRVQLADNGEQALELITHLAFALVFVDIVLGPPNSVDGLQVCQFAKQRPSSQSGSAPAVVVVTGLAGPTQQVRASLAGSDGFLSKPLIEADFINMLCKVDPLFRSVPAAGPG